MKLIFSAYYCVSHMVVLRFVCECLSLWCFPLCHCYISYIKTSDKGVNLNTEPVLFLKYMYVFIQGSKSLKDAFHMHAL